jgi:hypothetical protein
LDFNYFKRKFDESIENLKKKKKDKDVFVIEDERDLYNFEHENFNLVKENIEDI